jgi:polyadenylate-binding protein
MCLFNVEVLRVKIGEAKAVLDSFDDDTPAPVAALANQFAKSAGISTTMDGQPTSAPLPVPVAPSAAPASASTTSAPTHTIKSLSLLPAAEIIRLFSTPTRHTSPLLSALNMPPPDELVIKATDEFIDEVMLLKAKDINRPKQEVGMRLFKIVKGFGIKSGQKYVVQLLDTEDLRSLLHLANEYPAVLKEKIGELAK